MKRFCKNIGWVAIWVCPSFPERNHGNRVNVPVKFYHERIPGFRDGPLISDVTWIVLTWGNYFSSKHFHVFPLSFHWWRYQICINPWMRSLENMSLWFLKLFKWLEFSRKHIHVRGGVSKLCSPIDWLFLGFWVISSCKTSISDRCMLCWA